MLHQNEAGILLPPEPEHYPGGLVLAINYLRRAARLVDEMAATGVRHIPDRESLSNALREIVSEIWEQEGFCCEFLAQILVQSSATPKE